jgi:hypothetical protein
MQINQTFFKLKLLKDLLTESSSVKQALLNECINKGGTDSIVLMRRFRMISQLSQFESDIVKKIYNFEITSLDEFYDDQESIIREISKVTSRSA